MNNIDKQLLKFLHKRDVQNNITLETKHKYSLKKSKTFWILFILWSFLLCISLFGFILAKTPLKNLNYLNLDQNMPALFAKISNSGVITKNFNPEINTIDKELLSFLSNNDISYEISNTLFGQQITYDRFDIISKSTNSILLFGTDNYGVDVLATTFRLFFISVSIALLLTTFEIFVGSYIGMNLAFSKNAYIQKIINIINIFISIPDILYIFITLLIFQNIYSIYSIILISGLFRVVYWSYEYSVDELKKEYIWASKTVGLNKIQIINNHLFKAIIGKILILFARRIGYIIFLLASVEFYGYNIGDNIGTVFKNNWAYKDLNHWQITFPAFYLSLFLIINQFLANEIARKINLD